MLRFVFYPVVERIVNFPFYLRCVAWACLAQKRVYGGQKGCNITWGYVAWMGKAGGGG